MCDVLIDIPLTPDNLDDYYIKQTIFKSLCDNLFQFHGKLLDVGCGKMPYREYILQNSSVQEYTGLYIESALVYDEKVKPDYIWNGISMPFENEVYDCAIATEVLEHCPEPNVTLSEIFRVLKPRGIFFLLYLFCGTFMKCPMMSTATHLLPLTGILGSQAIGKFTSRQQGDGTLLWHK